MQENLLARWNKKFFSRLIFRFEIFSGLCVKFKFVRRFVRCLFNLSFWLYSFPWWFSNKILLERSFFIWLILDGALCPANSRSLPPFWPRSSWLLLKSCTTDELGKSVDLNETAKKNQFAKQSLRAIAFTHRICWCHNTRFFTGFDKFAWSISSMFGEDAWNAVHFFSFVMINMSSRLTSSINFLLHWAVHESACSANNSVLVVVVHLFPAASSGQLRSPYEPSAEEATTDVILKVVVV